VLVEFEGRPHTSVYTRSLGRMGSFRMRSARRPIPSPSSDPPFNTTHGCETLTHSTGTFNSEQRRLFQLSAAARYAVSLFSDKQLQRAPVNAVASIGKPAMATRTS